MTIERMVIELRAGDLRLALRPDLGGCAAGLWCGDVPVLRGAEGAALDSVRGAGCFPLVPYSGRLGLRRFRWQGRDHTTAPNYDDSPHSLHGVAWQRPWQVHEAGEASAELRLAHAGDAHWPFDFEVRQRISLNARALELSMSCTNTRLLRSRWASAGTPTFQSASAAASTPKSRRVGRPTCSSCPRAASRSRASTAMWRTSTSTTSSRAGRGPSASATRSSRCASPRRCRTSSSTRRATSPTTASSP